MTSTAMTNVEKCKKILDSIEARDTSAMGYEAKLRHKERVEQARVDYEKAMVDESVIAPARSVNMGNV